MLESFLAALNRESRQSLGHLLCRDVTFLTQDATGIRGRERVAALLSQLRTDGFKVRSGASYEMTLTEVALISLGWELRLTNDVETVVQRTEAMLIFAHRESRWKLLFIAPWGWPGSRSTADA